MPRKLKILHVTSNGQIGGREKMLFQLVNIERQDAELETGVLFFRKGGHFFDRIRDSGVIVYGLDEHQNLAAKLWNGLRIVEAYDVLVFHSAQWQLLLIGMLSGKNVVYRLSGIYLTFKKTYREVLRIVLRRFFRASRHSNSDDNAVILKKNNTGITSINVRRVVRRWLFVFFLKRFTQCIVVNSQYARQEMLNQYKLGACKQKIKIITNGIEPPQSDPSGGRVRLELKLRPDDFVIGTVCRFDVRKRLDRLLEGFFPLAGDTRFRLLIVGDGDDGLRRSYEAFVQRNGMQSQVQFAGFRTDVWDCLDAMNLFVLPSDNESFPNALIEALLSRKPSVVFRDGGGGVELVAHEETGWIIVEPAQIAGLAKRLAAAPDLSVTIGERARAFVISRLNLRTYSREYRALYREAV